MITTTLDPSRLLRAAGGLRETSAALRSLAPDTADDYATAAGVLDVVVATLGGLPALGVPIAPPAQPMRRTRLVTGAQQAEAAARADDWLADLLRAAHPEDGDAPSNRAIFRAAEGDKTLMLPRRVIQAAIIRRWPERGVRQ